MNDTIKGFIYGLLSAAFYGMNPLFALPLYSDGLSTGSVLFLRYSFAIPILALMIKWRGQSFRLERRQLIALIGLGLLMGYSSLGLFMSYRYMDAGIASSLLFVYPLMVALIMAIFFREKLMVKTIVCLAMALGGIYLLYIGGGSGSTLSVTGLIFIMTSSLSYAIYIVCVNFPSLRNIPTVVLTFYVILFGWLIFAAQVISGGHLELPSSPLLWGSTFALAFLPTAMSLILTTMAIQKIGSTPTAILGVFEPVTALFFGIIIFGETLTGLDVTGLLLIMFAVCLVIAGDLVSKRLNRIRKLFPSLRRN